ncbi:PAS domain S-box protein [Mesorhizobium sp. NBSH29]|uniref:histidine kinase dimerization/phospho-acceptor domain-containing protein n=1 Tax=Mesorhizobium sp. NBSH29 TaxID=2654249 RepID=UPI0018964916|nr:histidine kinase dimerization/phospho-acceptor domain-containing protein [Mesorhizobium sp. NBSH29]QPC86811.1 PAS domain S-box protein [Mesorhizobium sp. NBSH29]
MPSSTYSFLDIAVLDAVRQRFAAGDALAVLSIDLDAVIWTNGPGASLFGYADIEAAIGAPANLGLIARRQIKATSGFPAIGSNRNVAVRITSGAGSKAVPFQASAIVLPGGERAILLAASDASTLDAGQRAQRAVGGFDGAGHFAALIDGSGEIVAAAEGLAKLGIAPDTLAALVTEAGAQKDRLVKRMIPAAAGRLPAGFARLADEPALHLLVVVSDVQDEADSALPGKADVPGAGSRPTEAQVAGAGVGSSATTTIQHESDAGRRAPVQTTSETPEPAQAMPSRQERWYFGAKAAAPVEPEQLAATHPSPAQPEAFFTETPGGALEIPEAAEVEAPLETGAAAEVAPQGESQATAAAFERTLSPVRFVWRTDAEGKFSAMSPEFAGAVGAGSADVVGQLFRDVASRLQLDPSGEIAGLLERRDTWSGRTVMWPVSDSALRVPVDLAALPVYGRERNFEGFRGFGVARGGDAVSGQPAAHAIEAASTVTEELVVPKRMEVDAPETVADNDPFKGEVPALAIVEEQERRYSDKVIRLAEHRTPGGIDKSLSPGERNAFREIGDRLKKVHAPDGAVVTRDAAETEAVDAEVTAEASLPDDFVSADMINDPSVAGELKSETTFVADTTGAESVTPFGGEAMADEPVATHSELDATPGSNTDTRASGEPDAAISGDAENAEPEFWPRGESLVPTGAESATSGGDANADQSSDADSVDQTAPSSREATADGDDPHLLEHLDPVVAAVNDWARKPDVSSANDENLPSDFATAPILSEADEASGIFGSPEEADNFREGAQPVHDNGDLAILSRLPVPVIIHAGDTLHFANEEFFALTEYPTLEALADSGGLETLFGDPYPPEGEGDRKLRLVTREGHEIPVSVRLQSVPWGAGKALLLALTRVEEEPLTEISKPTLVASNATLDADDNDDLESRVAEMRAIVDTATDGVVVLDKAGTIRSISRAAEALFGFDNDDVTGKPFASLFAIESQRSARDYLAGLSEHGVASVLNDGLEVIGREAEGRFIPLFMTIGRLPNDSGYCAVVRDITQWKRAEEELTQARAQAERASSQKTDFLARVSHEIRTPLNAIIGFSELMIDEKFGKIGNDRYRDYLRDIYRSGNHVLDLVNDLLDISKIEAGEQEMAYEAVSLNDTLSETVAMMQPQANRERVIIRSSLASQLPEVVADLRSVRQIALNLLSNAVRYTQAGGQVIISTAYEPSGDIVMRVRDTGIGMSTAEIEQALKPFKQINALKRGRGDGTGLGLPLTKAMVEANRARFSILSTPGEGTLVEVTFPSTRVLAD